MVHKIEARYIGKVPTSHSKQIDDIVGLITKEIQKQSINFGPSIHLQKKQKKQENINFMLREILRNIFDAHAQSIEISCTHCPERGTTQIKFVDDGDGIYAIESGQKRKNFGYFGCKGLGEELIQSMSYSRPVFPHEKTWRKILQIPYKKFSGYRRYSDEHGSKTMLVIK